MEITRNLTKSKPRFMVYLDTSHLQKWQQATLKPEELDVLNRLRDSGTCKFVLSALHIQDMTRRTDVGKAIQLAEFLDTLPSQWICNPADLTRAEIKSAINEFNGDNKLQIEPFVYHYIDTLFLNPPNALEMKKIARNLSIAQIVRLLMNTNNLPRQGGISAEQLQQWAKNNSYLGGIKKGRERKVTENLKRVLNSDVNSFDLAGTIKIKAEVSLSKKIINPVEEFTVWLMSNLQLIPGTWFAYSVQHKMHKHTVHRWKLSDIEDLGHLAALPYVDYLSVDKRTYAFGIEVLRSIKNNWGRLVMSLKFLEVPH